MSLAIAYTRANVGVSAPLVTVETHIANGLPKMMIVGLPETVVQESKERVRCAILNSGLRFPSGRVTINLAPADLPKTGGRFDLAIALSILAASHQLPAATLRRYEVLGELALTGALRSIKGVLPAVIAAKESGRELILPAENAFEASLVRGARALTARELREVQRFFGRPSVALPRCRFDEGLTENPAGQQIGIDDIKGQHQAKRALQIAAAGNHNILFLGPPGTGKTMLASCLTALLPDLNEAQALEVAAVKSVAAQPIRVDNWRRPVLRSPHHTATSAALVGGGRSASPGEVTLAHRGVLFLDELAEFNTHVLDVLREPLEAGTITVSRARHKVSYPARFQLIAAMNPCPCGYHGDPLGQCHCTLQKIRNYYDKVSGPLLDRIDLIVEVPRLAYAELMAHEDEGDESTIGEKTNRRNSTALKQRIARCRDIQLRRCNRLNNEMAIRQIETHCGLRPAEQKIVRKAVEQLKLSARGFHRLLKIARTVADFELHPSIERSDLLEAISYRAADRLFNPSPKEGSPDA